MFFFKKDSELTFKPGSIEHAYFAILNDDLVAANQVFRGLDCARSRWGKALLAIINGYIERYPTYFEIRNFLEIDLDFLIKNEKLDYVEQVLGSLELLSKINQEVYKYAARVMFENKLYKASLEYMEKSKNIFYNDPELHFMYSKFYLHYCEYEKADFHINECLKILPEYYPAKLIKQELSKNLYN